MPGGKEQKPIKVSSELPHEPQSIDHMTFFPKKTSLRSHRTLYGKAWAIIQVSQWIVPMEITWTTRIGPHAWQAHQQWSNVAVALIEWLHLGDKTALILHSNKHTGLTLSPFCGVTGSKCSHATLTTLSSIGINNVHIPPWKQKIMGQLLAFGFLSEIELRWSL